MKNSRIEWIGEIPDDWNLIKVGSIFQCRNEKVNDTDYPPLSVAKGGVVPQMDSVAKSDANDNRKLVLQNDFVINSRSDRKQSCGYSTLKGSVSLINTVLYTTNNKIILPQYTDYLMKNYGFAEEFYRWGHGIVADLWTTRWQEMKSIVLPIPSIDIQQKIADYLDKKCAAVDRLIENQRAQIEKLKEYKHSVITEAVTRGLDPSAPLKDSGIEWLGKIPVKWNVNRLKYRTTYNDEILKDSTPQEEIIRYVEIGSVSLENGVEKIEEYAFKDAPSRARRIAKKDDIIISTVRTYLKAIASIKEEQLIVSTGFCVLRSNNQINNKYLEYFCKSNLFTEYVSANSYGISYPAINASSLVAFHIIEPLIEEQQQIADYLDKKCEEIDKLIAIKQQKIETLTEYKKSLIYEYVTGKKQVG